MFTALQAKSEYFYYFVGNIHRREVSLAKSLIVYYG